MHVSVLIPCYNSGEWLESTVRSAANQTLPPSEIICVDDASENDTVERLERLKAEIGASLSILRQPERKGIGAARNRGLQAARGEWIALLDHDDLWLPEKLETQAHLAAEAPRAALLHSRCWEQTENDRSSRELMHGWKYLADLAPFPYLFLSNFVVPCTVLIRREVLAKAGGFDERPELMGKDDIDLWLRLAANGFIFAHTETPLAVRRLHSQNYSGKTASFLNGRDDVLLEAFEQDLQGPRRLLVSEGVLRLLGILFDRLKSALEGNNVLEAERVQQTMENFLDMTSSWLNRRTLGERLTFGFPAFAPLASSLLKKNRRPEQRHQVECAAAAREALAHAGYFVAAMRERTETDAAFHELLRRAADSANRAARRAYRRRAEYETRYGKALINC